MPSAIITSKGQITIPQEIRDALGLERGDRVSFRSRADGVVELVPERIDLLSLKASLKPRRRGVSIDAMEQAIVMGATGQ